jgi:perosamine synthetase
MPPREASGQLSMRIPIARPVIGQEEEEAVSSVLRSGRLIQGERVSAFERAFADFHGAKHAVATSSGSTALLAALLAHGIGAGDAVILPSFTFFATAAAVFAAGATPVLADIDPSTFCLSPDAVEASITSRTRAVLPVHLFGMPADMPRFEALCARHGLVLLEDAAQAHGAAVGGRRVGTFGTAAFSFHASKNMTTGEGGMVLTGDDGIADRLRLLRHQGMRAPHVHEIVGLNFRMPELAAALGLVQLCKLSGWQVRRAEHAGYYDRELEGVTTPSVPSGYSHAYHQYALRVRQDIRDVLVERLAERGIESRAYYSRAVHQQPAFAGRVSVTDLRLPETERASRELLSIPVHHALSDEERAEVARNVNDLAAELGA